MVRALAVCALVLALAPAAGARGVPGLRLPATPAPPARPFDTVSSAAGLRAAVARAPAGGLVELAEGDYGAVTLGARRAGWVTVRPAPGATARFATLDFGPQASHIRVARLDVAGPVDLHDGRVSHVQVVRSRAAGVIVRAGARDVLVEGNRLDGADTGVELLSVDCGVPNAPVSCPASQTTPPIRRVAIRNNRITAPEENGVTVSHFRAVVVEGNEISGLAERGQHSDALQSLFGGAGLIVRHNYIHDLEGNQGIFIKDGRVSNVTVADNLVVRTRNRPGFDFAGPPLSFYDTVPDPDAPFYTGAGMRIVGNTFWDNRHVIVIEGDENRSLYVHRNVLQDLELGDTSAARVRANGIDQDHNLIADRRSTWGRQGPHDVAGPPRFRDPAANDYRLKRSQTRRLGRRLGVDWVP